MSNRGVKNPPPWGKNQHFSIHVCSKNYVPLNVIVKKAQNSNFMSTVLFGKAKVKFANSEFGQAKF